MLTVAAVALILLLIAAAVWTGRTSETKGNGDNRDTASRYGSGL